MMDVSQAHERRITLRLLAYWEKLRGSSAMPAISAITPADLADLWDNCFLVHVRAPEVPHYEYHYLGSAIANAYVAAVLSVEDSGDLVTPDANKLARSYRKVIETGRPYVDDGQFITIGEDIVKYRQCLLPLGADGRVHAIFGGMRFTVL